VDSAGWAAGDPLPDNNKRKARPEGVVDGVEDKDTSRTQHPSDLPEDLGQVGDVLEELPGHDDISDVVTQGEGHRIGSQGDHAVTRGNPEGRRREVDAHMTIGLEVGGEKATAATDVHE
jgi:hypothetical protein